MDSGQQVPQVMSSASKPQHMTNKPQPMQHVRTSTWQRKSKLIIIPRTTLAMSSGSSPEPEDMKTNPHEALDVPPLSLQLLDPIMDVPQQKREVMEMLQQKPQEIFKTQQKSQLSPQQNQQMKTSQEHTSQMKTMQHNEQEELDVLLEETSEASLPTPTQVLRLLIALEDIIEPRLPTVHPQKGQEDVFAIMLEIDFFLLLDLLPLSPMIAAISPSKMSYCDIASKIDILEERDICTEGLHIHDTNLQNPSGGETQDNQEQPSEILSDYYKNLISTYLEDEYDEEAENCCDSDCESTLLLANDIQEVLQDVEWCDLESIKSNTVLSSATDIIENIYIRHLQKTTNVCENGQKSQDIPLSPIDTLMQDLGWCDLNSNKSDPVLPPATENIQAPATEIIRPSATEIIRPSATEIIRPSATEIIQPSATEIKEHTYIKRLRKRFNPSENVEISQDIPLTATYCQVRHFLQQRIPKVPQKKSYTFTTEIGQTLSVGPNIYGLPAMRFVQRMSVKRDLEKDTILFNTPKIFCQDPRCCRNIEQPVKSNATELIISPILEIVQYLQGKAYPKVLGAHIFVFSALLQQLHRRNRAVSSYFQNIVADHLRNSELEVAGKPVEAGNSQAQIRNEQSVDQHDQATSSITPYEAVLRFTRLAPFNSEGFAQRLHLQLLLRMTCENLNSGGFLKSPMNGPQYKVKRIGVSWYSVLKVSPKEQQKNLIYRKHPPVTSASNHNLVKPLTVSNSRSNQEKIPTQNEWKDTQQYVSSAGQHNCNDNMKCSSFTCRHMSKEYDMTIKKLCDILCAGEDVILDCAYCHSIRAHNPEVTLARRMVTGSEPDIIYEAPSSTISEAKIVPDKMFLLLPLDEKHFDVWEMFIEFGEGRISLASFYRTGDYGFIDYVKTTEAPTYGNISHSSTKHAEAQDTDIHQEVTSTRLTNNTAPRCKCKDCKDPSEGHPLKAVSSAAFVTNSYEPLMEALTLESINSKKESSGEVLQGSKDSEPDDTEKDTIKKKNRRKRRRRRH